MRAFLRRAVASLTHSGPGYDLPQPARGDHVETWLKLERDRFDEAHDAQWDTLNDLLDNYRLHADTGAPLGQHARSGPHCERDAAVAS